MLFNIPPLVQYWRAADGANSTKPVVAQTLAQKANCVFLIAMERDLA